MGGIGSWFQENISRPIRSQVGLYTEIPDSPEAINPIIAAEAQAQANRTNSVTPSGATTWTQGPDGTWKQETTLSQPARDAYTALYAQMMSPASISNMGTPGQLAYNTTAGRAPQFTGAAQTVTPGAGPGWADVSGDVPDFSPMARLLTPGAVPGFSNTAGRVQSFYPQEAVNIPSVENAVYSSMADLFRPEFARSSRALEQRLANMGLPMGSEAYSTEMNRQEQEQNRAAVAAAYQATLAGRQEQDRQARLSMDQYAAQLAGQGQQFGQDVAGFQNLLAGAQAGFGNQVTAAQLNNQQRQGDFNAALAANAQRFGQQNQGFQNLLASGQAAFGNQLAAGAQNYDQRLRDFQAALMGQQAQFAQDDTSQQFAAQQQQQTFANQLAAEQQRQQSMIQAREQERALAAQLLGMVPGQSTVPVDVLSPMIQNQSLQQAMYLSALDRDAAGKAGFWDAITDAGSAWMLGGG